MVKCAECPRCKDSGRIDHNGNHFCICGMSGNMVYPEPRKEKRMSGRGWIHFSESSCGLYNTFDDAFNAMTAIEQKRWTEKNEANKQITILEWLEESNDTI